MVSLCFLCLYPHGLGGTDFTSQGLLREDWLVIMFCPLPQLLCGCDLTHPMSIRPPIFLNLLGLWGTFFIVVARPELLRAFGEPIWEGSRPRGKQKQEMRKGTSVDMQHLQSSVPRLCSSVSQYTPLVLERAWVVSLTLASKGPWLWQWDIMQNPRTGISAWSSESRKPSAYLYLRGVARWGTLFVSLFVSFWGLICPVFFPLCISAMPFRARQASELCDH